MQVCPRRRAPTPEHGTPETERPHIMNKLPMYNSNSKKLIEEIYHKNLSSFGIHYETLAVQTSYGKTSVTKIGNFSGRPVIALDGHKMITGSIVWHLQFLLKNCCIYVPGVIGQAGLSEEGQLPSKNYGFGKWLCEVIQGLDLCVKPIVFGVSFGGGIVANLICHKWDCVAGAAMICPISITRISIMPGIKSFIASRKAKKRNDIEWFRQNALKTNSFNGEVNENGIEAAMAVAVNCNIPDNMPMNVKKRHLPSGKLPTVIFYGDKDYLLPAERVTRTLTKHFPKCKRFFMKGYGHTAFLNDEAKEYLISFINKHTAGAEII